MCGGYRVGHWFLWSNGEVIMRLFDDYYYGFTVPGGKYTLGFKELVDELMSKFSLVGFR